MKELKVLNDEVDLDGEVVGSFNKKKMDYNIDTISSADVVETVIGRSEAPKIRKDIVSYIAQKHLLRSKSISLEEIANTIKIHFKVLQRLYKNDFNDPKELTKQVLKKLQNNDKKQVMTESISRPTEEKKSIVEYKSQDIVKNTEDALYVSGEEFEICKILKCPNIAVASIESGEGYISRNHLFQAVCNRQKKKCPKNIPFRGSEKKVFDAFACEVGEIQARKAIFRLRVDNTSKRGRKPRKKNNE